MYQYFVTQGPPPSAIPPVEYAPYQEAMPERVIPESALKLIPVPEQAQLTQKFVTVSTSLYEAIWSNQGGVLTSWKLINHKNNKRKNFDLVPAISEEIGIYPFSIIEFEKIELEEIRLNIFNSALYKISGENYEIKDGEKEEIRFSYSTTDGMEVEKVYTFYGGRYDIGVDIRLSKNGQPIEPNVIWGFGIGNPEDSELKNKRRVDKGAMIMTFDSIIRINQNNRRTGFRLPLYYSVNWAAFYDNYYVVFFLPSEEKGTAVFFQTYEEEMPLSFLSVSSPEKVYIGQKDYDSLVNFGHDVKRIMRFGLFGERLFIWIKYIHKYIPSWGFIIIVIALIITLLLFTLKNRIVLIEPSISSFEAIKDRVNFKKSIIAITISGLLCGILRRSAVGEMVVVYMIQWAIYITLAFYVAQILLWILSKFFGGKGSIIVQANLFATFHAPMTALIALLVLIPDIGKFTAFLLGLYTLILSFFGLRVIHNYSAVKTVLTLLIFIIVSPILLALVYVLWLTMSVK